MNKGRQSLFELDTVIEIRFFVLKRLPDRKMDKVVGDAHSFFQREPRDLGSNEGGGKKIARPMIGPAIALRHIARKTSCLLTVHQAPDLVVIKGKPGEDSLFRPQIRQSDEETFEILSSVMPLRVLAEKKACLCEIRNDDVAFPDKPFHHFDMTVVKPGIELARIGKSRVDENRRPLFGKAVDDFKDDGNLIGSEIPRIDGIELMVIVLPVVDGRQKIFCQIGISPAGKAGGLVGKNSRRNADALDTARLNDRQGDRQGTSSQTTIVLNRQYPLLFHVLPRKTFLKDIDRDGKHRREVLQCLPLRNGRPLNPPLNRFFGKGKTMMKVVRRELIFPHDSLNYLGKSHQSPSSPSPETADSSSFSPSSSAFGLGRAFLLRVLLLLSSEISMILTSVLRTSSESL